MTGWGAWLAVPTALAVIGTAGRAGAYRPFDTTDADVVDAGELELEIGPLGYLREDDDSRLIAPELVANLGLSSRFELVAEGRHSIGLGDAEPRHLIDDTALLGKLLLRRGSLQGGSLPSIAAEAGALLPNVNGSSGLGALVAAIGSQRWPALTWHLTLEAERTRDETYAGAAGTILEGPDDWAVRPVAESVVATETGGETSLSLLAGAIVPAWEGLSFDAAVRAARGSESEEYELRAGLTWGFALAGEAR